jgi:heat shock protein HspQ
MSYSDFDLKQVKQKLGIKLIEKQGLFSFINGVDINPYFKETLEENVPLARAINTEKARSALIIANVLVEIRKMLKHKISLFSGVEFNVDKERGLNGFCDFFN